MLVDELQSLEVKSHSTISYYDLAGGNSLTILYFTRHVNRSSVQVLLDRGSTNDFIRPRVAKFLNLIVDRTSNFPVVVGSGQ